MEIEYTKLYSQDDNPDKKGRWARVANVNGITIGWISMLEVDKRIIYTVNCYFPSLKNYTANESKSLKSFEEAKEFLEDRWFWFLSTVTGFNYSKSKTFNETVIELTDCIDEMNKIMDKINNKS